MTAVFTSVVRRVRRTFFPSKQDRAFRAWFAAQGDKTLRLDYALDAGALVLDVGGYEGQWASDIFGMYGCHIDVFEPVSSFAGAIARRFARNTSIAVHQFGLGGSSRTETIGLCSDGSSIFSVADQKESVTIVDIAEWLSSRKIQRVALIKINIEGGEYELLERLLATGMINIFDNIQVQFHPIDPRSAARMAEIQSTLSATHELTYQYHFVWENWRRRTSAA